MNSLVATPRASRPSVSAPPRRSQPLGSSTSRWPGSSPDASRALRAAVWSIALLAPLLADAGEERALRLGAVFEGELTVEAPVVRAPALDAVFGADAAVRGVRFGFDVTTAGPVTIDLRSYFFDAYLVLEDANGAVIAEDDDGLINTHARVVANLTAGRYAIVACAVDARKGPFSVEARAGYLELPGGPERSVAEIEDSLREVRAREDLLGPQHPDLATSLNDLAYDYRASGRLADAEPPLLRALEIREARLGTDNPDTISSINNLAVLYYSLGRYADAEPLYLRALEIRERELGPDHLDTAVSLNNLAALYQAQGLYADSERLQLRALGIREAQPEPEHPRLANSLCNLALLYESMGRHEEAEPLLLRALGIREATLGPEHAETAKALNNLANLYESQGRFEEAESLYLRALQVWESRLGPDHQDIATGLNNLAHISRALGRDAEAEPLYVRALEIREAVLGANHPETGATLNNLALLFESQGRYDEAWPLYARALEIQEATLGPSHPDLATMFGNVAVLLQSLGRFGQAEALLVKAAEIHETTLGHDHPDTTTSLDNLVYLLEAFGRFREALPLALRSMEGGQAWVVREILRAPGDRRLLIAALQRDSVYRAVSYWSLHDEPRPPLDTVYRGICSWKGVALRTVSRVRRSSSAAKDEPAVQRLRDELVDLDGQVSALAYSQRIVDPVAHNARLLDLRKRRRGAERELLRRLGLDPEPESTDGAELSRLLPDRSAVLDFLVHRAWHPRVIENGERTEEDRWGDPRLLCFVTVADAGQPVLVDLGDVGRLRATSDAWLDGLTGGQRGSAPAIARLGPEPSAGALDLPLDPLLAVLPPETDRLFVIPEGFVGQIPLGSIRLASGEYLLERFDVVYASDPISLRSTLRSEVPTVRGAPAILAVGGVDYDHRSDPPSRLDRTLHDEPARRPGRSGVARSWQPLDGTAVEIADLLNLATSTWPALPEPQILGSTVATEERLKAAAPGKAILHVATHGFFNQEGLTSIWQAALRRSLGDLEERRTIEARRPSGRAAADALAGVSDLEGDEPGMLAGLVLAGANLDPALEPDRDDGILTATEVSSLDLSACRLAVLSACQTSVGAGQSGEGLQSLRRAFHEAGARTVIASLWKVDDEATQQLMHRFYEELWTNGCGPGEALRRARLALMQEKKDPYYWGAFTLSGEWR